METRNDLEARKDKRVITIMLVAAALLIGLGAFLFVEANIDTFGEVGQVALVTLVMLVFYFGGWKLSKTNYTRFANSLFFVAVSIYGALIYLVFDIYQLVGTYELEGITLWLLGIIAVAVITQSLSIFILSVVAGLSVFSYLPGIYFFNVSDFNSSFVVLILLIATVVVTYCVGSKIIKIKEII